MVFDWFFFKLNLIISIQVNFDVLKNFSIRIDIFVYIFKRFISFLVIKQIKARFSRCFRYQIDNFVFGSKLLKQQKKIHQLMKYNIFS